MGPALGGLDRLLKLPTGCGEQNMLNFAPNIYVLEYLTNTDQLAGAVRDKAIGFLRTGRLCHVRTRNTVARVVTGKRYTDSSPSNLKERYWLPIDARVKFKITTLTFKALNTGNPPYLASLLHRHTPCRTLRSASANLLSVTRCNLSFGTRGFRTAAPTIWNSLPANVRSCVTLSTFRRITPLSVQFPHCLATHPRASDSLQPWRYTNLLTYLLTYA